MVRRRFVQRRRRANELPARSRNPARGCEEASPCGGFRKTDSRASGLSARVAAWRKIRFCGLTRDVTRVSRAACVQWPLAPGTLPESGYFRLVYAYTHLYAFTRT